MWVLSLTARAQVLDLDFSTSPNALVPDYPALGIASTLQVSAPWLVNRIERVEVSLNLAGTGLEGRAFNGDYYVFLTHTDGQNRSGMSVLLNRVGRDAASSVGYGDNGFALTFQDHAGLGDVHTYRLTLGGDATRALADPGVLTGFWQPDGRELDPASVLTSDARTAWLSEFAGLDPNGEWSLYLQDFSPGGEARLVSWGVSITCVPEPRDGAVAFGAGLLLWGALRRWLARRAAGKAR